MIEVPTHSPSKYEIERKKPMPSLNHGLIQANLITEINNRYRKIYSVYSELSLDLADWSSVPDISIYPKAPIDLQKDVIAMSTPPICAIEITSPSQSLSEMVSKARAYFEHGVKSCWIVLLPLGNVYVFSAPNEYEIYRSNQVLLDSVLEVEIPLGEVFE